MPDWTYHTLGPISEAVLGERRTRALAVLLISLWGWRRGEAWVWWSLLAGCSFGVAPVLAVHFAIGYTHFEHLFPVYALVVAATVALILSKRYLTAKARVSAVAGEPHA